MSMTLMAKAMSIKVGNPLRKLVLIKLADNANDKGECWPSYQHIADHCECSKSAVRSHIDALIEMGFLIKENRLGVNNGKGNTSNIYYLDLSCPVPPESIAPMLSKSIAMPKGGSPMPSKSTPPMPSESTRTSHSFEPVKEPKDNAQRVKPKNIFLPDDFKPSDQHAVLAAELNLDLDAEFLKFVDYHLSKASKFAAWDYALNNWLRTAASYQHSKSVIDTVARDEAFTRIIGSRSKPQTRTEEIAAELAGKTGIRTAKEFQGRQMWINIWKQATEQAAKEVNA